MKDRDTQMIRIGTVIVAAILAVLTQTVLSSAQETRTRSLPFGIVGLARGETARLNVVDVNPPDPDVNPPDPDVPSCTVRLSFANGESMPFLNVAGDPPSEFTLTPGIAAYVDLNPREAFGDTRQLRVQFRGKVEWVSPPEPDLPDPCIGLVATLEIFDNLTGRTQVLYALPPVAVNPPDPDAAPLGQ